MKQLIYIVLFLFIYSFVNAQITPVDGVLIPAESGDTLGKISLRDIRTYTYKNYDVIWTNAVGVSVNGNSLTKTASSGWGNAGAASVNFIPANTDGYVEVTASETNKTRLIGLSKDTDFSVVEFTIVLRSTSIISIFESGTSKGDYGTYTTGDTLRVERLGNQILYKKNGTTLYTSTLTSTSQLFVNCQLENTNSTITDVVMFQGTSGSRWTLNNNNIFYDAGTVSVGANMTGAALSIRGDGSTSATSALHIENSLLTDIFSVKDNGEVTIPVRTGTANTLTGFTSSDVMSDVAIGAGLSLSGGTLSSTIVWQDSLRTGTVNNIDDPIVRNGSVAINPINSLSPNSKLEVGGKMMLADSNGTVITGVKFQGYGMEKAVIIGNRAGQFATPDGSEPNDQKGVVYIGNRAGQFSTNQNDNIFIGDRAGERNSAARNTGVGRDALQQNSGDNVTALGYNSGQYNRKGSGVLIGADSGESNTGSNTVAIGAGSGKDIAFNENTAVGANSFPFVDDDANKITLTETEYVTGAKFLAPSLITYLGTLGKSVGDYISMKINVISGTPPSGIVDGLITQFQILSADTLVIPSEVQGNPISGVWTNCACSYEIVPQSYITNSTAIGYDARPTVSHEIRLGDDRIQRFQVGQNTRFNVTSTPTNGQFWRYNSSNSLFELANLSTGQGITENSGVFEIGSSTSGVSVITNRRFIGTSGGAGEIMLTGGGGILLGGLSSRTADGILDAAGYISSFNIKSKSNNLFGTDLWIDNSTDDDEVRLHYYRQSDNAAARNLKFYAGSSATTPVLELQGVGKIIAHQYSSSSTITGTNFGFWGRTSAGEFLPLSVTEMREELSIQIDTVFVLREVAEGLDSMPSPGVIPKGWYRIPAHLDGYTLDAVTYTLAQFGIVSGTLEVRLDYNFAASTDGAATFAILETNKNADCNTVVSEGDIIQLEIVSDSFLGNALGLNYELIFTLE